MAASQIFAFSFMNFTALHETYTKILSKLDSTYPCLVYQKEIYSESSLHFCCEEPHSYHGILIYGHSPLYKDNIIKCGNL